MGLLGNFSYLYNWKTGNQKQHTILVTTRTSYCTCLGLKVNIRETEGAIKNGKS